MLQFFANLPWYVRGAFMGGGTMITGFSSKLPDALQEVGLLVGISLVAVGAIASIWHFLNERRVKSGKGKLALEPSTLLPAFAVITLIGIVGVIGCLFWQVYRPLPAQAGETTVVKLVSTPVVAPVSPTKLVPNIPADLPASDGDRASRWIKLMGLISEMPEVKNRIEQSSSAMKQNLIRPMSPKAMGGPPSLYWATRKLKETNDLAYSNRPINLDTIDQTYLAFKVAGEEALGDDVETIKQFRSIHYLKEELLKEADKLLSDMEQEFKALNEAIKNTPLAKKLEAPK